MEELKGKLKLRLSEEKKTFKCDFSDKKFRECIEEEFYGGELENLSPESSRQLNLTVINCLDSILISCVGKKNWELDAVTSEAEITLSKNEKNLWEIKEIDLTVNLKTDDAALMKKIENCLKFFNVSCASKTTFSFNISYIEPERDLKYYKQELLGLKKELEKILGREIKIT